MSDRDTSRGRRLPVRLLLALGAALLVVPVAATAPAAAAARAAGPAARIDITSQTPWVEPKGTFVLSADITGASKGSKLAITLHRQPLADRDAFSRSLFGVDLGSSTNTVPSIDLDDIAPSDDGSQHVNVVIGLTRGAAAPGQIGLSRGLVGRGVYPLELDVLDKDGHTETGAVTYLVRLPDAQEQAKPLRAALLLDLHAPPTIGPTGSADAGPRTFDQVATIVQAINAFPTVPVTLRPTPETIEALARTSDATRSLLTTLQGNLEGRQLLDAPYVDVPFTAWVNAGMDDALDQERARGNTVLTRNLTAPDSTTWVADADLTTTAASKLWESGVRQVVLPDHSFAPIATSDDEPTLARPFEISTPLATPISAVAIDARIEALFERQSDPQLTAYDVLAELAIIEGESPDADRGVVLAAPAGWQPSAAFLRALLQGLRDDPLVQPVTVSGLFADVAPVRTQPDQTGPVAVRPLTPSLSPSIGTYPQQLDTTQDDIASYEGMVGADPTTGQWAQRLLISGSQDLSEATRARYLAEIDDYISRQVRGIDAPKHQTVTLTSRAGNIPLTLRSRLRKAVKVVLALQSNERLEFPHAHGDRIAETLQPGTQQIELAVRARSPGDTPLTVRVLSPDGNLSLTSAQITVRSTAISGIGYVLSVGAALFLVVWWARHWRRDRRARRTSRRHAATAT